MACFCGGRLEKVIVNEKIIDKDGDIILIKHIPAFYCESCKQTFFDVTVSDKLDELQRGKEKKHVIAWGDQFGE